MPNFTSKANPNWSPKDFNNKDKWQEGEWGLEPDHYTGEAFGFPFEVLRMPTGHLCGYVGVPEGHPLYGSEGEELRAHGGITFTNASNNFWWFGFDAAHSGDFTPSPLCGTGTYRNLAYMVKECVDLARQLAGRNEDRLRRAYAGFVASFGPLSIQAPSFEKFKAEETRTCLWLAVAKAIVEWSPSDAS